MASLGVACFGSVQHVLGVASLTSGHVDRAVEHLREAVDRNLALCHWPALRTSRLRYAQALARRGQPHDIADIAAATGAEAPARSRPEPAEPIEPAGPAGSAATCTREGRRWRIELGSRGTLVGHSIGMLHLAVLLANLGAEIPAIELAAGVAALGHARTNLSAQPMLDRQAIQQYRQRLSQLHAEIDELESRNERERAAGTRKERNWLIAELAAGAGLGGRSRRFPDSAERARLAVGRAIRRAIARIHDADPYIGVHLRNTVHTGMRCSYEPASS
jgi:hypothetical protein